MAGLMRRCVNLTRVILTDSMRPGSTGQEKCTRLRPNLTGPVEPFECLTLAVVSDPGMRITAAQSAQPGSIREPGELCELLQDRSH
jgi:hypothetical protein